MRAKQLSFLPKISLEHGGSTRVGKRKIARPIDPKRPIHLVLRSTRAKGSYSFLHPKHEKQLTQIVTQAKTRTGIQVYRFANVGNHLHFVIKTPTKRVFQSFLREVTGKIARLITGALKGSPQGKFWDHLAYTRVLEWGRSFKIANDYLIKNLFEAAGLLNRKDKKRDAKTKVVWLLRGDPGAG